MKETYKNIARILSEDRKTTSYKFALLRSVIEVIDENSPFIQVHPEKALIPFGLLMEKWILYYYVLLDSENPIPQGASGVNLAFEKNLRSIIQYYSKERKGGLSALYTDIRVKGIPDTIKIPFTQLLSDLRKTIHQMPMRHIGVSVNQQEYSIFKEVKAKTRQPNDVLIDFGYIIKNFGFFEIPLEYFEAFKILGSFIGGQHSIIMQWAEFSSKRSNNNVSVQHALEHIMRSPVNERDALNAKRFFELMQKKNGRIHCVWTSKKLTSFDLDHVIPFSVWKNNDLWNLLPTSKAANSSKSDKIPSPDLVERQKDLILEYWENIHKAKQDQFEKEAVANLLGDRQGQNLTELCLDRLKHTCTYLIDERGFESWMPKA